MTSRLARIAEIIKPLGVVETRIATTPAESEALWQIRRSVSASLRKVNPDKFNEDICVPRSKVPEMIRKVDAIAEKYDIPIVNFGHAGDGNIHVNIMIDKKVPGRAGESREGHRGGLQGSPGARRHHERRARRRHRQGRLHPPGDHPEASAYMKTIKRALDPNNILNPGKIFLDD